MKTTIFAAIATLALAAIPAAAEPIAPENAARVVPVSHTDLDLTQSGDAQALLNRLRAASARACAVDGVRAGPTLRRAIEACRAAALSEAVAEVNSAELTRLHAEQSR